MAVNQDQNQGQGNPEQEVAQLFQNVGQGLMLVNEYIAQAAPDAAGLAQDLLAGYEQLIQMVAQSRQGQGQAQGQPASMETGGRPAQQVV